MTVTELNKIYCGDSLEVLKTIPDNSIDCGVTSPPYYGLRDYGVDGQIGLEETPEQYIKRLVSVFSEFKRVLKLEGTLWVNIGDSYAGSSKGGAHYPECTEGYKQSTNKGMVNQKNIPGAYVGNGLKPKDLIGIPWMLAFALRADGWYLRQDIIWSKPNPMPESVTDRCTKGHEYIFLLSKSDRYYYDADAISEPVANSTVQRLSQNIDAQTGSARVPGKTNGNMKAVAPRYGGNKYTRDPEIFNRTKSGNAYQFRDRRNKRDVWNYEDSLIIWKWLYNRIGEDANDLYNDYIAESQNKNNVWTVSTKPFKEAHFATLPEELITPCILAGCPTNGVVLDMFFGSGTTGLVALKNFRNFIGIELNPEYVKMAERRLKPYLSQVSIFDCGVERR